MLQVLHCMSWSSLEIQICTIPLDTAKVRMQLQKKKVVGNAVPKYRGMLDTVATIVGKKVWQNFGMPDLHRLRLFGGLRIELYEPSDLVRMKLQTKFERMNLNV